jgi:tetratricopeptide (TPR) repeat protein
MVVNGAFTPDSTRPRTCQSAFNMDDSSKADDMYEEGEKHRKSGKFEEAMQAYSRAIGINPKFAKAYLARGVVFGKCANYRQAIIDCNKSIELDPSNARAYLFRGAHYRDLRDPRQAIRDFDKAIELAPYDASGYIFRAVTYANDLEDHFQRAIDDYKSAARLGDAGAQNILQKMGIAW